MSPQLFHVVRGVVQQSKIVTAITAMFLIVGGSRGIRAIGGEEMTYPEREKIIENLPFASRLAYIAFCVERCRNEARRHPGAQEQLEKLPLLKDGYNMLWVRATEGTAPDPERVHAVLEHVSTYEVASPDGRGVVYAYDVTLVGAARVLLKGMRVLSDPSIATPRYVAGALEGPIRMVGLIYADWQNARKEELAIIDKALLILSECGNKPLLGALFAQIPDWSRGEMSKRYAEGRLKGSADDDDE